MDVSNTIQITLIGRETLRFVPSRPPMPESIFAAPRIAAAARDRAAEFKTALGTKFAGPTS